MKKSKLYIAVTAACFGLSAQTILADDTETAPEVQEDSIEIIEVTARRRVESLNRVPVMVSAFNEQMLEQQGFQSIDDIARFAPGLSFSKAFGRATERPVIRGMSNVLAGVQFGVESGAAYFIDGVYYAGSVQSLDMADIQRVEVIKGPQSALYGRNSYSGAINFITKGPDQHEFGGRVKASIAEHNEHNVQVYLTGPINDWLAVALSIRDYSYGGEWTNLVTEKTIGDESSRTYSFVADAEPTDALHVRWRIQNSKDDDGTRPFFLQSAEMNNCFPGYRSLAYWPTSGSSNNNMYFCGEIKPQPIALNDGPSASGQPILVPGVPQDGPLPGGPVFFGNLYDTANGMAFSGMERDLWLTSLAVDYQFDSGFTLDTAVTYRRDTIRTGSDSDHSPINFTFAPGDQAFFAMSDRNEVIDKSFEIQLRSPIGDFEWMLGAFYYQKDEKRYELNFASPRDGVFAEENDLTNKAVFGSVEYTFNDQWKASLELRWSEEDKWLEQFNPAGVSTFEGEGSWRNFTPRMTVNYQYSPQTMLFGVLAQGVKPGGLNGAAGAVGGIPRYEQEETTSVELGVKTRLFNRLNLAASVFRNEITDLQLTTAVPNPTSQALISVATNQGKGQVQGLELEAAMNFSANLVGRFNYALADSKFTNGCDDFQWSLTSGGGQFNDPLNQSGVDFSADFNLVGAPSCSINGNAFPMSSKHQASAFLEYMAAVSGDIEGFVNFDVSYESKKYVQVHNLAYVPAATIFGARVGVRADNWSLTAYGRNLGNEDSTIIATRWLQTPYFTFAAPYGGPAGAESGAPRAFFGTPRRGRQVGLELMYRF